MNGHNNSFRALPIGRKREKQTGDVIQLLTKKYCNDYRR